MKNLSVSEVSKIMDIDRSGLSSFLHGDDSKISKKNCVHIIDCLQAYRLNNDMSSDVCIFCGKMAIDASNIGANGKQYFIPTCEEHHKWGLLFEIALKNNYQAGSVLEYHKSIFRYINILLDKNSYKKQNLSEIDNNIAWLDKVMTTKDLSSKELYLAWMEKENASSF